MGIWQFCQLLECQKTAFVVGVLAAPIFLCPDALDDMVQLCIAALALDHVAMKFCAAKNPKERHCNVRDGDQRDNPGNGALRRARVKKCNDG